MSAVTYMLNLDLKKQGIQAAINAKKGEAEGRKIIATLSAGSEPWEILDGTTAILRAVKPDGTTLYNKTEIAGNTVQYTFTTQTVTAVGAVECELQIIADKTVLFTPCFVVYVEDTKQSDNEIESTNEYTALTETLQEAQQSIIKSTAYDEETGNLTITYMSGKVETFRIKGDKGDTGATGPRGEQGVGILGVQQIAGDGSPGTSNVYKMDYTDGSFFVFSVYNGADGKDGGAGGWNTLVDKPFESTGDGLIVSDGVLSVDVATDAEEDNTKPITSAAVYNELGNIEILLQTI